MFGLSHALVYSGYANEYRLLESIRLPDRKMENTLETTPGVSYDLLRLKIAAKLYYEKTGLHPRETVDLVPLYFETELKNRKTGAPYVWEEGVPAVKYSFN